MTKYCHGCKAQINKSLFGKDKYRKDGLTTRCRECKNKSCREWAEKNPDKKRRSNDDNKEFRKVYYSRPEVKMRNKNSHLKRGYGITLKEFEAMLEKQNNVCAICKNPEFTLHLGTGKKKTLSVDHCHVTGAVRGLLCVHCNRGLGSFKDNLNYLNTAIEYLKGVENEN